MSAWHKRLVDAKQLGASWNQPKEEAADVGTFRKLEIQVRLLKTGTAGTIALQHAPVNEDDSYEDLPSSAVNADGSGLTNNKKHLPVNDFYRFVRAKASSDLQGSPVVTIDIVAKE